MLANPDIAPSASINRWIVSILMFHFQLIHVPGTFHGPDGLSRRKPQLGDPPEPEDDFEDWIDQVNGFPHMIMTPSHCTTQVPPVTIHLLSSFTNITTEDSDDENDDSDSPASASDPYAIIPRSEAARKADDRISLVKKWHSDLKRPQNMKDSEYETFLRYCTEFFVSSDRLWRKDSKGEHKLVIAQDRRMFIITMAHNDTGHHGYFATYSLISLRYWWPFMGNDIAWFIKTCQICQTRRTQNVLIPPTVATPAPLFAKIYVDTMHMPPLGGFKYIIQGRCSISHWPEFEMLHKENAKSIGDWLLRNFIYR